MQPRNLIMPIEEYDTLSPDSGAQRVLVEMKSTQSDMTGAGLFSFENGDVSKLFAKDTADENNTYSLVTEGLLTKEGSRILISYEEEAIRGVEGCSTVISFDSTMPECVTVERRGRLSSSFVISRGERLFSVYETPYGLLDMCIYAKKVENTVTDGEGSLILDYAVELKGLTAQRTRMEVKVRPLS